MYATMVIPFGRLILIAAGAIALLSASSASAQKFTSGNWLFEMCTADNPTREGLCLGFVSGSYETMAEAGLLTAAAGLDPCIPQGVTNGQARDLVIKFLREFPERRHESAASLILDTFRRAYPCPRR